MAGQGDSTACYENVFFEKRPPVKTESPQWLPAWKRFILYPGSSPQQAEHGIGSRGGIFSGGWVRDFNDRTARRHAAALIARFKSSVIGEAFPCARGG
jgi:hypothetical protein